MVRGKLEAIREISPQEIVIGEVLFVEREGKYFNSAEPTVEAKVEVLSFEDIQKSQNQAPAKSGSQNHPRK